MESSGSKSSKNMLAEKTNIHSSVENTQCRSVWTLVRGSSDDGKFSTGEISVCKIHTKPLVE